MRRIIWMGQSIKEVRAYPEEVRQELGFNLDRLQRGLEPRDYKNMVGLGQGIKEMRIHGVNEYRLVYIAKFEEAIYVLHSFIKKTEKTAQKEIELIKVRYLEVIARREK